LQINKATGVEVVFNENGEPQFHAVTIRVKNDRMVKESIAHRVSQLAELKIDKKNPISLVCNGKGVLIKKVIQTTIPENPASLVFPQANPSEFYTHLRVGKDGLIVAIARKELIDSILALFEKEGYTVLEVFLGIAPIQTILPFIEDEVINIRGLCIKKQGNDFDLVQQNKTSNFDTVEYLISSQYIQSSHLLSYGSGTYLLANSVDTKPEISIDKLSINRTEFIYKRFFNLSGASLLGLLFVLLLTNFFLFNYYFRQNEILQTNQTLYTVNPSNTGSIEDITKKESLIAVLGWKDQQISSFLADRLASYLPKGMWLKSLHFYPPESNKISEGDVLRFKNKTISLQGECEDASSINLFMSNIKTIPSVYAVDMKSYGFDKDREVGIFTLEILIK